MKKKPKRIVSKYGGMWGYKDIPFNEYDEVEVIPNWDLGYGKAKDIGELKKVLKVGRTYKVKPRFRDDKFKAKLVAVYSDPVSFENKGKNTDVRLKTEWKFLEPIGSYGTGKHEIIEDNKTEDIISVSL